MTQVKRRKGWRMSCDLGEVTERLENEQRHRPMPGDYKKQNSKFLRNAKIRLLDVPVTR